MKSPLSYGFPMIFPINWAPRLVVSKDVHVVKSTSFAHEITVSLMLKSTMNHDHPP